MTTRRPRPGAALVAVTVLVVLVGVLVAGRLVPGGDEAGAAAVHHHAVTPHPHAAESPAAQGAGDGAGSGAGDCPPGTPTAAETAYVVHMVEHHRQAVQMAALLRRAEEVPYRIQNLADHVAAVQRGEVADMEAWLEAWEQAAVPGRCVQGTAQHSGHRRGPMTAMPGMVSQEALGEMAGLRGQAAGRRWVELMIEHHQGAVSMSEPVARSGANPWVLSLARHVVADQEVEIGAMQRILRSS